MHKNALFEGGSTLVAMVTTAACSRPGVSFSYKNVAKKKKSEMFISLSQAKYMALLPYIGNMLKSASATFLEIDCDEIPVPPAVLQGYWVVKNLHTVMIFARVVVATGFYM